MDSITMPEKMSDVVEEAKPSLGQLALVPVQFSATSQTPAGCRQTVLEDWKASDGHAALDPVQCSATSQVPADVRHTVLDGLKASAGHAAADPVQFSATSQSPAEARHWATADWKLFGGQVVLDPVQVSSTSQKPAAARQTAPAFPAGCWQSLLLPSHSSRLHGLPSEVHAVPAAVFVSAGQSGPFPGQLSAGSHSPAEARQTVLEGLRASAGHTVLDPVQVSSTSQSPAAARHTAPPFPAGCWQSSLLPSHSSRLHGLPSDVHAVPAGLFASAGQLALVPVQ